MLPRATATLRLAADLDYHLIMVEDGCADRDPDVHRLLMAKVSPWQGTVIRAKDMVAALAALSGVYVKGGGQRRAPSARTWLLLWAQKARGAVVPMTWVYGMLGLVP